MIVLEVPHQRPPTAYHVDTLAKLREIAEEKACRAGMIVFETTTPEKILDTYDERDEEHPLPIVLLGENYGYSAPVYRADYLKQGEYTHEEITEWQAVKAAIAEDLYACVFFENEAEVEHALLFPYSLPYHQKASSIQALRKVLSK